VQAAQVIAQGVFGIGFGPVVDKADGPLPAAVTNDPHHAEFLIRQYGERALVDALGELGIPVLIMVSSWERAVNLKEAGCRLLGEPGFGKWTPTELDVLWERSRPYTGGGKAQNLELVRECGELSGAPGILLHELRGAEFDRHSEPLLQRARLIHAEWENGRRALNGEDMQGVTGRFPDKDGVFYWDAEINHKEAKAARLL
jgi:hypothetical protein